MNIFNIFPASVSLASVRKILGVCIRKTRKHIPQSVLWISRLFVELVNRNDSVCLTLDWSNIDKDGVYYYNVADDEQVYNEFVSQRINESEATDKIQFKSKTNREKNLDASS